jgi:hypothetical protein
MTHAWCSDVSRDAAVRAAEDGRTGPLPTLGECIEGMFPKSGSASSAVEHENKGDGMATDGLRTERVVLEITQFNNSGYKPASEWDWDFFLRGEALTDGESVRVVEEPLSDAWAQRLNRLTAERDAAIRERDELRGEIASVRNCWGVSRAANDVLKARVAELEARNVTAGEGSRAAQAASGGGEQPRGWLSEDERACLEKMRDELKRLLLAMSLKTVIGQNTERDFIAIESILARSSPPEVVLSFSAYLVRENVIAALKAAGVAVKEVG